MPARDESSTRGWSSAFQMFVEATGSDSDDTAHDPEEEQRTRRQSLPVMAYPTSHFYESSDEIIPSIVSPTNDGIECNSSIREAEVVDNSIAQGIICIICTLITKAGGDHHPWYD